MYRLHETPMAWKCAVCGKLFSITVQEAVQSPTQLPPPYLEREFRLHNCELQLLGRFYDIEIYDVENWPEEGRYEIRATAYGRTRG